MVESVETARQVAEPSSSASLDSLPLLLLAHYLKLDEQIVRLLLGRAELDVRLAPFCQSATTAGMSSAPVTASSDTNSPSPANSGPARSRA
jgi:hypothetical protein